MFTKTRQLIQMTQNKKRYFVDTPGWLYHYEPYGIDIFIHHVVTSTGDGRSFRLGKAWRASDPSTGMSLFSFLNVATRKQAVEYLYDRLSDIPLSLFNEKVLLKLAESPPHKATWRFNSVNGFAVEVTDAHRE